MACWEVSGKQVAILYEKDGFFRCRPFYDLVYKSQRCPRWVRPLGRAEIIKRRLGVLFYLGFINGFVDTDDA